MESISRSLGRLGCFESGRSSNPVDLWEDTLKGLAIAGVVLLVLGILSFVIPVPNYHHHGVRVGDAHVGVTTRHDEKIAPVLSIVLVVAGAGLLIAGSKS